MKTPLTNIKNLALYHYDRCPYCAKTRRAILDAGQEIELRNIQLQPQHYNELLKGGGKAQVPCLRIDSNDGNTQWLYESDDIIDYLAQQTQTLTT